MQRPVFTLYILLLSLYVATASAKPVSDDLRNSPVQVNVAVTPDGTQNPLTYRDEVTITVSLTNTSAQPVSRLRVDFRDSVESLPSSPEYHSVILGRHLMMTSAEFSHGQFYKTTDSGDESRFAFIPEDDESNALGFELAYGYASYSWVIDDLFRNGSLAPGETAQLVIKADVIKSYFERPDAWKDLIHVRFFDEATGTATRISAPIVIAPQTSTPYAEDGGVQISALTVAPNGLQAGEPFFIQLNIVNENAVYQLVNLNGMFSKSLMAFDTAPFYQTYIIDHLPSDPREGQATPVAYLFVSGGLGNVDVRGNLCIDGSAHRDHFLFSTERCDNFRVDDILFPTGLSTIWIQGVAGVNGGLSIEGVMRNPDRFAKSASLLAEPLPKAFGASQPVEALSLAYEAAPSSAVRGGTMSFSLRASGADLKKVMGVVWASANLPKGLTITQVQTNFSAATDPEFMLEEFAGYSNVDAPLMAHGWSNVDPDFVEAYRMYREQTVDKRSAALSDMSAFVWQDEYVWDVSAQVGAEMSPQTYSTSASLEFGLPWLIVVEEESPFKQTQLTSEVVFLENPLTASILNEFRDLFEPSMKRVAASAEFEIVATNIEYGIAGEVFEDTDGDGVKDANEAGLVGWQVELQTQAGTQNRQTDATGRYAFDGLAAGEFRLSVAEAEGWRFSIADTMSVILAPQNPTASTQFGVYRPAAIAGLLYHDLNNDGGHQEGEPGLHGWEIEISYESAPVEVPSAVVGTDDNGGFSLTDLRPGAITATVIPPDGWTSLNAEPVAFAALSGQNLQLQIAVPKDLASSDAPESGEIPTEFALGQNYPNPFNPSTVIPYALAASGPVRLSVFDVTGRLVARLVQGEQSAGRHTATFDASRLTSGMYLLRMEAGGMLFTKKVMLVK